MNSERKVKFVDYDLNIHPELESYCMDLMRRLMPEDQFRADVKYGCIYPDGLVVLDEDGKRWKVSHRILIEVTK